jgi:hypothetical protein
MVPKSASEALDLDKSTGTLHWIEAINREGQNVDAAFQELEQD